MIKLKINDLLNNIIEDENDPTRRLFRAWITGGYDEAMYERNMERIKNCHTYKKLRSFVIEQFTCFIAYESGCSYNHAQKCIVNYYNNLNNKFAEDWRDDHLGALTSLLMEEIDQTYVELNPDCNRAPATEAGENAIV